MNNRKATNKRGICSRGEWIQLAPEPQKIRFYLGMGDGKQLIEMDNPKYGRIRRIIHQNK